MTRKLATIRRIKELIAIPGADRIELAIVDGWQVVVVKGEFAVGDLGVYFEIDSFIPTHIAPFLTAAHKEPSEFNGVKGERLKTTKRMKQLSQGLLLPISSLKDKLVAFDGAFRFEAIDVSEGADITEVLNIQKWEAPEEKASNNGTLAASPTRAFPAFLRKTDQERVQNYGHIVERSLDEVMEVTMKKDGSSITVFRVDPESPHYKLAKKLTAKKVGKLQQALNWFTGLFKGEEAIYGICSRNVLLSLEGESNFHKGAAIPLDTLRHLKGIERGMSLALQGELVAPDIQGNYEKVNGIEFHLFDIFDIDRQEYLLPSERRYFADKYEVPHVTVLATKPLREVLGYKEGDDIVKLALAYAEGPGDNKDVKREGVVFKSETRDFSFKAVSNSYLLATGK